MSTRTKGLGKGLDALFDESLKITENQDQSENINFKDIELDILDPNPSQPRIEFSEENLQELAQSIKNQGVLQPILVRKNPDQSGRFQIIAGERRWRAAQLAGLTRIPVRVVECDEQGLVLFGLIENIHRQDLNPVEEAQAYKTLLNKFDISQSELAKKIGKSRSFLANAIRLLSLEEEILEALKEGIISVGHARTLLGFTDETIRSKVFQKIILKKLSVREVEKILLYWKKNDSLPGSFKKKNQSGLIEEKDKQLLTSIANSLSTKYGVSCQMKGDFQKGKIIFSYSSKSQFDELIKIFQNEE